MSEICAWHEAGHAFMAIYVGARVLAVTIDPDWDDGPNREADIQIEWPRSRFTDRQLHERLVQVALAGPVAEMLHTGDPFHPGFVAEWTQDWNMAWDAAAVLFADDRKRLAHLEQTTIQLYAFLNKADHWSALAAVVDHLLAHERLEGEEVEDILNQWMP